MSALETQKGSRHYTPLHIRHLERYGEFIGLGKEVYFRVLVFYRLFYKRNKTCFTVLPYVTETLVEVLENSKQRGYTRRAVSCSHCNSSFKLPLVFLYNCMETRKIFYRVEYSDPARVLTNQSACRVHVNVMLLGCLK